MVIEQSSSSTSARSSNPGLVAFFKQIGIVGIFSFYAWARTPAGLFLLLFLGYLWWKNIGIDSDTFANLLDRGPEIQDVSLNTDQGERKSSTDD